MADKKCKCEWASSFKISSDIRASKKSQIKKGFPEFITIEENPKIYNLSCNYESKDFYKKDDKIYCILHAPFDAVNIKTGKKKINEHELFNKAVSEYLEKNISKNKLILSTINFINFFTINSVKEESSDKNSFQFHGIDLDVNLINTDVYAYNAVFFNPLFLRGNFDDVNFNNSEFLDAVMAEGSSFNICDFGNTSFDEAAIFTNSVFNKGLFNNTVFGFSSFKRLFADFSIDNDIDNPVNCFVNDELDFSNAVFNVNVNFSNRKALFKFNNTVFKGKFDFDNAVINKHSYFYNTEFSDLYSVGMDNCYRALKQIMLKQGNDELAKKLEEKELESNKNISDYIYNLQHPEKLTEKERYKRVYELEIEAFNENPNSLGKDRIRKIYDDNPELRKNFKSKSNEDMKPSAFEKGYLEYWRETLCNEMEKVKPRKEEFAKIKEKILPPSKK